MVITMRLDEILRRCNDWETFCEKEGWSEWSVNEGGGHIRVALSEEKAKEYGLIK